MRKTYNARRSSLNYDNLLSDLRENFDQLKDQGAANIKYSLSDVVMSVFAMFNLKYPSLLSFEQSTEIEKSNLRSIFGIKQLCSDVHMRRLMDVVDSLTNRRVVTQSIEQA